MDLHLDTKPAEDCGEAARGGATLCERLRRALSGAELGRSKLPREVLEIRGFSSPRVRHFLNLISEGQSTRYLEVGTWKGSTLVSAAFGNSGRFVGVDNFSEFRFRGLLSPRATLARVRKRFEREAKTEFVEGDAWEIPLPALPRGVEIYLYDGEHSEESHVRAFTRFDSLFAREFVALVDDWNWEAVRSGTRRAFDELRYSILDEIELRTRGNRRREDWWNGFYAAVLRKREDGPLTPETGCARRPALARGDGVRLGGSRTQP